MASSDPPRPFYKALKGHHDVISKLVSLHGDKLASVGADNTVRIFAISGECLHVCKRHSDWVGHLAVIDDDTIISVGDDGQAVVWSVTNGACLHAERLPGFGKSVTALDNGRIFVGITMTHCRGILIEYCWNGLELTKMRKVTGAHAGDIWDIASCGERIVTASSDRTARVWNATSLKCEAILKGHTDIVRCVAMDDRFIVTGSWDHSLRVYETTSFGLLHVIPAHKDVIRSVCLVHDGMGILSGSRDETVAVHDLQSGRCNGRESVGIEIYAVVQLPNGFVAVAGNSPFDVCIFPMPSCGTEEATSSSWRDLDVERRPTEVFISHAGPDKTSIAIPLYEALHAHGVSSFLDQAEMKPGDDAVQSMICAMETAPILVVIASPQYCARLWTIKELACVLERDERAKEAMRKRGVTDLNMPRPGQGGRPIIIPVFYRLSLSQCRYLNLRTDVVDDDEHHMKRYNDMLNEFDVELQRMKNCMRVLAGWTGIENLMGATNEDTEEMNNLRQELIMQIVEAVLRAVRIVRGA